MEARVATLQQCPELPLDAEELRALHADDEALSRDLAARESCVPRFDPNETGFNFYNQAIAERAQPGYTPDTITALEDTLTELETTHIPTLQRIVTVDGVLEPVKIMTATTVGEQNANHGDMSTIWYLRDQVQAASALLNLARRNPARYQKDEELGKELLVSTLHALSTPAQLARFEDTITLGEKAGQADWPHISLRFNDLDGVGPNGWRNKQDSFQMLAYEVLDAIDAGQLDVADLADGHKRFLGSVVPLLASVGYPRYESSGSWEELEAHRTSVLAVETALMHKMQTMLANGTQLDFLEQGYQDAVARMPADMQNGFRETLDTMTQAGLHELGQRIPYESPEYTDDSLDHRVKFREADAALSYVLMYGIPQLLADNKVPIKLMDDKAMSAEAIEDLILTQLSTLEDPVTGGIIRYEDDSYQRTDFHTNAVQLVIRAIKKLVHHEAGNGEIDLVKKQDLRNRLTPAGRPAAWIHPLGQRASWAAERSLDEMQAGNTAKADFYRDLSVHYCNRALSTVSGQQQWQSVMGPEGRYILQKVTPNMVAECFVANQPPEGEVFYTLSAHNPLNWAAATVKRGVGMLAESVRQQS